MQKYTLKNLDCANCALKIENEVNKLSSTTHCSVDFSTLTMHIETNNINEVIDTIKQCEPEVEMIDNSKINSNNNDDSHLKNIKKEKIKILLSVILFICALILEYVIKNELFSTLIYLITYIIIGYKVLLGAIRNIKNKNFFDELFLMSLATVAAICIREYSEAAGVMIFYSIGELLQDISVSKSRQSIKSILNINPETVNFLEKGINSEEIKVVHPETINIGDYIYIKPGERVALDGVLEEGQTQMDTSALTGETVPRKYSKSDELLSGILNISNPIKMRVTRKFEDSTTSRIMEMVENASHKKAKTETFITKFSKIYTPIVVLMALLIAVVPPFLLGDRFDIWIKRATVLLVISCPCALVLSIPLAYFLGIGEMAKNGILLKGSNLFEPIDKLKCIMLDKTGTITKGKFEVVEYNNCTNMHNESFFKILYLMEYSSNHPIAKSILKYCEDNSIFEDLNKIKEIKEIAGRGIIATIDNVEYYVGNMNLLTDYNIKNMNKYDESKGTIIHIATKEKYLGNVIIGDTIKPEIIKFIEKTKQLNIKTIMLTGDAEHVARKVSDTIGLDEYYANLLPEDKLNILEKHILEQANNSKTAYVGDGINDTPVLVRSDIGISMGQLGSDAAIELSDVVIVDDNLYKIIDIINISRKTKKIIYQNLGIILFVKLLFIFLGTLGLANMWEAVFSDVGVALIAIINANRILSK